MKKVQRVLLSFFLSLPASAQSSLPLCPTDTSVVWTNCFGVLKSPDGENYVGEWKDGKKNGHGTTLSSSGAMYIGEYKDDQRNGQGTYIWASGAKYVGEYNDGKRNGQGSYTWPDGEKYVGEWKDGKRNGPGIMYNPSGIVKESGTWSDGQLSQSFAIDTTRFPFDAVGRSASKPALTRETNKKTSVEIVNDCLVKGLKPSTSQFSKCIAGQ